MIKIINKKIRLLLSVTLMVIVIVGLAGCNRKENQAESTSKSSVNTEVVSSGEELVIPIDEVSDQVSFYPVEVDGVDLEVIAVKASDGTIRTAFNTCQICYSSGRGYYEQSGDALICQNCGNQFATDQVELESGGCNPWPIFDEKKTVDDDNISISYDFLKESTGIFENWKVGY
ncbi:DUF2318 domain-containing protein [Anaerosporobacter sp.]